MSNTSIITLLSDFGLKDVYVGVMKGVITKINPNVQLIDLTHEIPPQNLAAARFNLMNAYNYFPRGTIHLAVVDPGVGSTRRGVAIQFAGGYLVGPDNGLFSGVLSLSPPRMAVSLTNQQYWDTVKPSFTFHGRDIFATAAAYLSKGIPLQMLGDFIDADSLVTLSFPDLEITDTGIIGCIQYIDHFGNLITNVSPAVLKSRKWTVKIGDMIIPQVQTYSDVKQGDFLVLVGSHGWLEIAVNGGNAQLSLGLNLGDRVSIIALEEPLR